jgi:RNA polymerase sigma factor (sigma-70 family)
VAAESGSGTEDRAPVGTFATTRWSVVLAVGRGGGAPAREALGSLFKSYWYPLYAYVRRLGHGADEAEELTQSFFAALSEPGALAGADPERGRFRAFLVGAMRHHLAKRRRWWSALKRGGGARIVSIDAAEADRRYALEPADERSPERVFERAWALLLVERARASLRAEYEATGKLELHDRLASHLAGEGSEADYRELAQALDSTEGAIKVAVHRLRKRFRSALEDEIADTVADPAAVQDEIRHLFEALGR